ncbi:MAG: conjugative transfer signal peptidase TraF [Candidatus Adiutrix sp.]|jgi:conjugative transfer signal peptidase TraF|nr:conjugative transfer signal peptidase TraF [Candidatus Adiutrix sp.]
MNAKNYRALEIGLLLIDLLAILLMAAWIFGFRVNITSSMPMGVYLLSSEPVERFDIVSFCLPPDNPHSALAEKRGYLQSGLCPNGQQPLLKRLAGIPGDRVEIKDSGIVLNDRFLLGTKRPTRDRRGRVLPDSLLHQGIVPDGQALVLSQEHAGSFDSRHFGLVPMVALKKVKPVVVTGRE